MHREVRGQLSPKQDSNCTHSHNRTTSLARETHLPLPREGEGGREREGEGGREGGREAHLTDAQLEASPLSDELSRQLERESTCSVKM